MHSLLPRTASSNLGGTLCRLFNVREVLSGRVVLLSDNRLHGFRLAGALLDGPHMLVVSGPFVKLSTGAESLLRALLNRLAGMARLRMVLVLSGSSSVPTFVARIVPIRSEIYNGGVALRRCLTIHGPVPRQVLSRRGRTQVLGLPCNNSLCRARRMISLGGMDVHCNRHAVLGSLS